MVWKMCGFLIASISLSCSLAACASRPVENLIDQTDYVEVDPSSLCDVPDAQTYRVQTGDAGPVVLQAALFDELSAFWSDEDLAAALIALATARSDVHVVRPTSGGSFDQEVFNVREIYERDLEQAIDIFQERLTASHPGSELESLEGLFLAYWDKKNKHNYVSNTYMYEQKHADQGGEFELREEVLRTALHATLDYTYKEKALKLHFSQNEYITWMRRALFVHFIQLDLVDGKRDHPSSQATRVQSVAARDYLRNEAFNRAIARLMEKDRAAIDQALQTQLRALESTEGWVNSLGQSPTGVEVGMLEAYEVADDDTPCRITWTKAGLFVDLQGIVDEAMAQTIAVAAAGQEPNVILMQNRTPLILIAWREVSAFREAVDLRNYLEASSLVVEMNPALGPAVEFVPPLSSSMRVADEDQIETLSRFRTVNLPAESERSHVEALRPDLFNRE